MARYELGAEFWDISQEGTQLVIVSGSGRTTKESTRKFVSADKAYAQLVKLVGEKLAAGYVLVEVPSSALTEGEARDPRDAELERAIFDDPYSEDAYSVYGDWLQRQGDPRGELIALQLAEEANPDDRKVRQAARRFLESNLRSLANGLADHLALRRPGEHGENGALVWRFGFIHRIELDREADDGYVVADVVRDVTAHPSGRFLAEISVLDTDGRDVEDVVQVFERMPPALRSLSVIAYGDFDGLANLDRLEGLRSLTIKARRFGEDPELSVNALRALVRVPTTLKTLELKFGGTEEVRELLPLFARTDLTALRTLRLRNSQAIDELVRALAASPFAPKLTSLDVGMAELDDTSLQLISDKLPALKKLGIARNMVSPRILGQLATRVKVKDVRTDRHDVDDDDRFDEALE